MIVRSSIVVAVLACFTGLSFVFIQEQKKTSALNTELTTLKKEMKLLQLRQQADDLFIKGAYEDATKLYLVIDSLRPSDSLIASREQDYKKLFISSKNTDRSNLLADRLNTLLEDVSEKEHLWQEEKENLLLHIQDERNKLLTRVQDLEKKLEVSLADKKKDENNEGIIRFQSPKGQTIIYIGEIVSGKAFGQGFGVWSSGSIYDGQWKNNKRDGSGIFEWPDGERYEGEYINDLREGKGTYTTKNGERYTGNWTNDVRHGRGELYESSGKLKVRGEWRNDKLVKTFNGE